LVYDGTNYLAPWNSRTHVGIYAARITPNGEVEPGIDTHGLPIQPATKTIKGILGVASSSNSGNTLVIWGNKDNRNNIGVLGQFVMY
jgi:hypothetical protein